MRVSYFGVIPCLLVILLSTQLTACFPVLVGGAAAGGAMAADRRTSGIYIEDKSIKVKAENILTEKLGGRIHANVSVFNRSALITGEAVDEATKAQAESLVKDVSNVKSVTNELAVDYASRQTERNNDTYITSKVKGRMITANRFPAIYVKVTTEATVVYLMGLVTHQEADDAVEIARTTDGVAKVVKVFEYID